MLLTSTCGLEAFFRRMFHSAEELKDRDRRLIQGWCFRDDGKLDLDSHEITHMPLLARRYKCLKVIGEGTFAQIIEADDTFKLYRSNVAIKIMNRHVAHIGHREAWCLSVIHARCKGLPAVKLLSTFYYLGHFCLCLELGSHCLSNELNLVRQHVGKERGLVSPNPMIDQCIHAKGALKISLDYIRKICTDILLVIIRLEHLGLMHGDLKPENILLSCSMLQENAVQVKTMVADFGNFIHLASESRLYEANNSESLAGDALQRLPFECQSICYRAPEVLVGCEESVQPKADVWSLGMILLEMVSGYRLLGSNNLEQYAAAEIIQQGSEDNVDEKFQDSRQDTKSKHDSSDPRSIIIQDLVHLFGRLPSCLKKGHYSHLVPHQYISEEAVIETPQNYCKQLGHAADINHRRKVFDLVRKLNQFETIDSEFGDFLCGVLHINPKKRWSALEALNHSFLQSHFPSSCICPVFPSSFKQEALPQYADAVTLLHSSRHYGVNTFPTSRELNTRRRSQGSGRIKLKRLDDEEIRALEAKPPRERESVNVPSIKRLKKQEEEEEEEEEEEFNFDEIKAKKESFDHREESIKHRPEMENNGELKRNPVRTTRKRLVNYSEALELEEGNKQRNDKKDDNEGDDTEDEDIAPLNLKSRAPTRKRIQLVKPESGW